MGGHSSTLLSCPRCGHGVYRAAQRCPRCPRRPGVRAAGAVLGMAMFVALSGIMENVVFIYATGATFLLLLAVKRYLWDGWRRHRNVDPRAGPGSGDGIGDAA